MHKTLPDGRHTGARLAAKHAVPDGDLPPAQEGQTLFFNDDLEHLHPLAALQFFLREEEHPRAVLPLTGQVDAQGRADFGEKTVRHLGQNAHAVAGLSLGVPAGAMLQIFHNGQRVGYDPVAFATVDIGDGADTAAVMLPLGAVQGVGYRRFHGCFPPVQIKTTPKHTHTGRFDVVVFFYYTSAGARCKAKRRIFGGVPKILPGRCGVRWRNG